MMPNLSPRPPGPLPVEELESTPQAMADTADVPPAPEDVADVSPVGEPVGSIPPVDDVVADLAPAEEPVADLPASDEDVADTADTNDEVGVQAAATVGAPTSLPETARAAAPVASLPPAMPSSAAPLVDSAPALHAPPGPRLPLTAQLGMPTSSAEVRDFVRQAALERGIDPDVAVRVVLSEGGVTPATWVGDRGSSFGPLQLHYGGMASGGNAVAGLGDAFSAETHLNARDLNTWRQQVQWGLDRVSRDGWGAWHGAAAAGIGPRQGIGVVRPTDARMVVAASGHAHVNVPNQFAANLSVQDAYAACGPAAAVAVARFLGRSPTVAEALEQAKQVGWTAQGGMNGIANEKRLLDAMHIAAQIETPLSWRHVQTEASRGTPVIVSTPNHYWVIDDYDPITREYHVGQSGLAYRGGGEWMTAERIQQLGGGANGALYVANPLGHQTAPVVTVRLDVGWSTSGAAAAARGGGGSALEPGWRPLDPGWSMAGAPSPVTTASPAASAAEWV